MLDKHYKHVLNILKAKLNPLLLSHKNKKKYENIYDIFFYIFRVLRLLFRRCLFINKLFIKNIIEKIKLKVMEYFLFKETEIIQKIFNTILIKTKIENLRGKFFFKY